MFNKVQYYFVTMLCLSFLLSACKKEQVVGGISNRKAELGKKIFFDKTLSNPEGQACASCHAPEKAFSDPLGSLISEGAVKGLFGKRNGPSIMYAMFTPPLNYNADDSTYVGGLFLDGRTNSLQEQALKPFLSNVEMNMKDVHAIVAKVKNADYYNELTTLYGNTVSDDVLISYVADAIANFEQSQAFRPFSSKYDFYLKGQAQLTPQELNGLKLFQDTAKGKCANCHITDRDEVAGNALFTDFTYDNIGVPKNNNSPFLQLGPPFNDLGINFIDYGLAVTVNSPAENGKFKVPTLRNVAVTAPYFHNGFYTTLEEAVHFYNSRDVDLTIPKPEVPMNVNKEELGNLKLTPQEEADIVVFLKTLTDGYK